MIYKGYTGALEVDEDSGELFGTVLGTRDTITFVGKTVEEARKSLQESVDFYLERCAATGKEPDRPFSGRFNVRIPSEVHRELAEFAHSRQQSLNDIVVEALDRFLASNRWAEPTAKEAVANPKRKIATDEQKARNAIRSGRASAVNAAPAAAPGPRKTTKAG